MYFNMTCFPYSLGPHPKSSDIQVWANNADPDQMPQNAASDLGLHCLPLIQQVLDTSTGIKMD